MPIVQTSMLLAMGLWLLMGLTVEAMLARRQILHLRARARGAAANVSAYGSRRALMHWLGRLERLLRLIVWLASGLLATLAAALDPLQWWAGPALFVGLAVVDDLLTQPLLWLRWLMLEQRFGTSRMRWTTLAADSLRRIGVNATLAFTAGIALLWPFVLWAQPWAWLVSASLLVAGLAGLGWARPNVIAPLFNHFRELPDGELRRRLADMTARCGARLTSVRVMDNSRRSQLANAYFSGVGRSKRVVLFDTLIERLSPAELEAVMAHELGHDRCGHQRRYSALLGVLIWIAFTAGGISAGFFWPALSPAFVCCALYLLLPCLAWPMTPWLAFLRRRYEYEADAFAARHASPRALYSALETLLAHNLSAATMDWWYAVFYATHPPGEQRLAQLLECQTRPPMNAKERT